MALNHLRYVCVLSFTFLFGYNTHDMLTIIFYVLQKSYHYIALLKTIMRLSMTNMKAANTEDVASSITAIANEKRN